MDIRLQMKLSQAWGELKGRAVTGFLPNVPNVPWCYTPTTRFYTTGYSPDDLFSYVEEVTQHRLGEDYQLLVIDPVELKIMLDKVDKRLLPDLRVFRGLNDESVASLDRSLKRYPSASRWLGFYSTADSLRFSFKGKKILASHISAMQMLEALHNNGYYILGEGLDPISPEQAATSIADFITYYCIPNTESTLPKALCVNVAKG